MIKSARLSADIVPAKLRMRLASVRWHAISGKFDYATRQISEVSSEARFLTIAFGGLESAARNSEREVRIEVIVIRAVRIADDAAAIKRHVACVLRQSLGPLQQLGSNPRPDAQFRLGPLVENFEQH